MREKLILPPVYWIEWIDSSTRCGWLSDDSAQASDLRCWTIGFIATEDDEAMTVAGSYSAHESWLDPITIPKVSITKMYEVDFAK